MPTPESLTIPDKLDSINATKQAIREAIVAKGVEVPEGTTFYEYAGLIGEISVGTPAEYVNVRLTSSGSGNGLPDFMFKSENGWQTIDNGKNVYEAKVEKGSNVIMFLDKYANADIASLTVTTGNAVAFLADETSYALWEAYVLIPFSDCTVSSYIILGGSGGSGN